MAQATYISGRIRQQDADAHVELVGIVTDGDRGIMEDGKGAFVKAVDEALLDGRIDLAVHSAKDVPAQISAGLVIAAVPTREDPADLLVSPEGWSMENIPPGIRIGTSSVRRQAQFLYHRSDVNMVSIRGNVDTRLSKIEKGICDAVIVAAAGINRLGGVEKMLAPRGLRGHRFDPSVFLPAPTQGALMLISMEKMAPDFSFLSDPATEVCLRAERRFVETLGADCQWPVGGHLTKEGNTWTFHAALFSCEGKLCVCERMSGENPDELAAESARRILDKGGRKILQWNRDRMGFPG